MKDGMYDKLHDLVADLETEGTLCMVVGADATALDEITCCDDCKIKQLQSLCLAASWDLLNKYRKYKNARSH